ncbi:MAG: 6-hydroxymethylpterin diphosphokinase MptE-like protein [Planctomycetota bacterium]|jgi:hypothetical protein
MDLDKLLSEYDWTHVDLVLVAGLGSRALRPKKIREKTSAPILVFEPNEKLRKQYQLVKHCLVSATATSLRARLRHFAGDVYGEVLFVADHEQDSETASVVQTCWGEATEAVKHKNHSAIYTAQSRVTAMLSSLDLLVQHPPINHLHGTFEGMHGVVVGAGPSLDKNIDVLKEHRDKFVVAAVNSSWPALDAVGIEPDFVVICEAKPVGSSIESIPSLSRTILVPGLHVHRDTWDLPWMRIAPALSNEGLFGSWATKMLDVLPAPIGGSTCCLAAGIFAMLGCSSIILVGNDCAPDDGKLYCNDAAFAGTTVVSDSTGTRVIKSDTKLSIDDINKSRESWSSTVETWSWDKSRKIQSLLMYDALRQWFEEVGEHWKKHVRIVNATEGGAHMEHWEHVPLIDVVEDLESTEFSPREFICEELSKVMSCAKDKVAKSIDTQITGAKRVGDLAREGIKLMKRAREIQTEIKSIGHGGDLLDAYTWGPVEQARRKGDRPVFDVFQEMFQEIDQGSVELIRELTGTKDRINDR